MISLHGPNIFTSARPFKADGRTSNFLGFLSLFLYEKGYTLIPLWLETGEAHGSGFRLCSACVLPGRSEDLVWTCRSPRCRAHLEIGGVMCTDLCEGIAKMLAHAHVYYCLSTIHTLVIACVCT